MYRNQEEGIEYNACFYFLVIGARMKEQGIYMFL